MRSGGVLSNTYTIPYALTYYYVAGWLSEFNALTPNTYNVVPNGADGAMLWLNNYCKAHPLSVLDEALYALTVEAYPVNVYPTQESE